MAQGKQFLILCSRIRVYNKKDKRYEYLRMAYSTEVQESRISHTTVQRLWTEPKELGEYIVIDARTNKGDSERIRLLISLEKQKLYPILKPNAAKQLKIMFGENIVSQIEMPSNEIETKFTDIILGVNHLRLFPTQKSIRRDVRLYTSLFGSMYTVAGAIYWTTKPDTITMTRKPKDNKDDNYNSKIVKDTSQDSTYLLHKRNKFAMNRPDKICNDIQENIENKAKRFKNFKREIQLQSCSKK